MRITPPFVFATGNVDKARELMEQLAAATQDHFVAEPIEFEDEIYGFIVTPADQHRPVAAPLLIARPDVAETGSTLEANARIKAQGMQIATGLVAIADDTGLHVDALGGAPGVYSARFAGPGASSADNVKKLLHDLALASAVEAPTRTARFVTAIHIAAPDGDHTTVFGAVEGLIAAAPCGDGTFGYDPIFIPNEGDGRTFGEMQSAEKHALSHRGRAFRSLLETCVIEVERS